MDGSNGTSAMRLKDKVAVVTGGGRGIGRDIALAYAHEGAHVIVNDIDPQSCEATAAEAGRLGTRSLAVPGDVARPADIARLIDTTMRERGRVDIVVNNAMKIVPGKLESLPEEAWDTTMNIGLKGAFLVSQAAARHMIEQRSGVILTFGGYGRPPADFYLGGFQVALSAVDALRRQLAAELGRDGIRVLTLQSTGVAEFFGDDPTALLGGRATLADVGNAAAFAASHHARAMTGTALNITCGAEVD